MRLVQVLVPDDQLEPVTEMLEMEEIDHVRQRTWVDGDEQWLVACPVPTDAVGHVLDRLAETGLDVERYVTITSIEAAMAPGVESLQDRFANDFDPLAEPELRAKARDLSRDPTSFFGLILLSAIIAVAGLLVGSPAVVVGSMVIAPIVGPVLTATVGAATGDREMFLHSVWIQAAGIAVAVVGAAAFSGILLLAGFFPPSLDVSSIDLIGLRVAPNVVTIAIGLAAGAAGAFGLSTKGPTSLIGVMIAAALIPAAATVGIAASWGEYRIALGSFLLVVLTMILINVGAYVVLRWLKYRPEGEGWLRRSETPRERAVLAGTAIFLVILLALVGVASLQQIGFEREVNGAVQETFAQPGYEGVDPISVRIQYEALPLGSPETVTVTATRTVDGDPPRVAGELDRRIEARTGQNVQVRVLFEAYQRSS